MSDQGGRLRVAIDGPAGAGKSTVARQLADRLGFVLVDTGALYRTVALAAQGAGVAWDDAAGVTRIAEDLVAQRAIEFAGARTERSCASVRLFGDDVSEVIRAPDISLGASRVSAIPGVRAALLDLQRQAGGAAGVVLEGRDIGTVVFPDAEVKFFLTASPEERARRRHDELVAKGANVSYDETLSDVVQRDRADAERAVAPLMQAQDAIVVDSSGRPIEVVVEQMARVVEARRSRR